MHYSSMLPTLGCAHRCSPEKGSFVSAATSRRATAAQPVRLCDASSVNMNRPHMLSEMIDSGSHDVCCRAAIATSCTAQQAVCFAAGLAPLWHLCGSHSLDGSTPARRSAGIRLCMKHRGKGARPTLCPWEVAHTCDGPHNAPCSSIRWTSRDDAISNRRLCVCAAAGHFS
jgi:hypothetical protein